MHSNFFRDYDPRTGRYLEADPIGQAGDVNLYGYAVGSPTMWADRSGLAPFDFDWDLAARGLAVFGDGFVPFIDPFSDFYDPCDPLLRFNDDLGRLIRDIELLLAFRRVSNTLFAREAGLANSRSPFRLGWGWFKSKPGHRLHPYFGPVFRASIGSGPGRLHPLTLRPGEARALGWTIGGTAAATDVAANRGDSECACPDTR